MTFEGAVCIQGLVVPGWRPQVTKTATLTPALTLALSLPLTLTPTLTLTLTLTLSLFLTLTLGSASRTVPCRSAVKRVRAQAVSPVAATAGRGAGH